MKKAGFKVVFSDVLPSWASRARKKGLASFFEDSENPATNPEKVLAYASYQPFMIFGISFGRLFEMFLKSEKGLVLFDFFQPKSKVSAQAQRALGEFAAFKNVNMKIIPIDESKTIEGGQLCLVHFKK